MGRHTTKRGSCKYPGLNCLGRANKGLDGVWLHGYFCWIDGDDPDVVHDFDPMSLQEMEELYSEDHD